MGMTSIRRNREVIAKAEKRQAKPITEPAKVDEGTDNGRPESSDTTSKAKAAGKSS